MEVMGKDTSIWPLASAPVHTHVHAPEHTHTLHTKTDVVHTHNLHTGEVETNSCWPASLAKSASSGQRETLSQNTGWAASEEWHSKLALAPKGICTHVHQKCTYTRVKKEGRKNPTHTQSCWQDSCGCHFFVTHAYWCKSHSLRKPSLRLMRSNVSVAIFEVKCVSVMCVHGIMSLSFTICNTYIVLYSCIALVFTFLKSEWSRLGQGPFFNFYFQILWVWPTRFN